MATIDSGTETLFSDDSPCDFGYSGDETEIPVEDVQSAHNRLAPPNIQPYSGVLEKGKVLIRPIAFKPTLMSPGARFGLAGERYGSTPILTRPGSRSTLYGSTTDLHQQSSLANYSLDRKLKSSCPSTSSSPPLAVSSFTSLPHRLMNYDSLESVRKSPISTAGSCLMLSEAGEGSISDLTPSPSDSGVSELEAALRDRDSELAYLRETMEHNEQVIFRVYQEKEKVWERELRRLKSIQESRLRASAQKAMKLEQMLMMQTYQVQQDKKRLCGETQRANCQNERLRQEIVMLRSRLEETEWSLCQKTGEISLLKTQLKDYQMDQSNKCQEFLHLRNDFREVRVQLDQCDLALQELHKSVNEKDNTIQRLQNDLQIFRTFQEPEKFFESETNKLKAEISQLRQELSDMSLNEYGSVEPGRIQRVQMQNDPEENFVEELETLDGCGNCCDDIVKFREEIKIKTTYFERQRLIWAQEKEKVLRYQHELQMNYVKMYRKTRALEAELANFEQELRDKKQMSATDETQTIEL